MTRARPPAHRPEPVAGQVAIVTGGGGVIGRAICLALARAGAAVGVADLSPALMTETVAAVEQAGGRAFGVQVDVTDRASVDAMVEAVVRELGPVDLLVNNAGLLAALGRSGRRPGGVVEGSRSQRQGRHALHPRGAEGHGRPPSRADRQTSRAGPCSARPRRSQAYPTSKTAVTRLTEHLAADTREYGISVFAITPGLVYTPLARQTFESEAGRR